MKRKKYIVLTTIIISLLILFVPRGTYAKVSEYYAELKYNETTLSLKEQYQNEIDLITEYIKTNGIGGHNPNNNKYVIGYDLSTFNSTNKKVILIDISNTNNYIESTYGPYRTNKNVRFNVSMFYQMFNINNGNVVATSGVSSGNTFFYSYFADYNCNPTEENCIIDTNSIYYDTSYINEQYSNSVINLRDTYINDSTYYFIPLKVGNIVHLTSTELNAKEFFNSMGPQQEKAPYCTKTQPLGMFENPSEFSINISGISNALKEHIQGIITISYEASDIINTNQWEITDTISEYTTGDYELKCSTEQQKCELWFDYNYEDDIDTEINLNFKFKTINGINMPTFVRLYSCLKNYNDINITYDSIKNTNTGQTTTENKLDNIVGGIGSILNFLNPTNLIYIIVPTEEQMQSLLNEMQESINNKLGILGLPLTIYTRLMNLANTSTQENWCLSWNGVKVPNFEDFEIIGAGNWCFNEILENEQINTFRNICINIIGGLILLAFIQYLHNTYNKVVDAPDRDEYEYITTEDVYTVNNETGELTNHVWKKRRTVREKVDK